jgi:hypothetical protein
MKVHSFLFVLLYPLSVSGHGGFNGLSAAQTHMGSETSATFTYRNHDLDLKNAWTGRNFPGGKISKGPKSVRFANAGTVGSNDASHWHVRKTSKKESKNPTTSEVAHHSAFPSSAPSDSPSASPTSSSAPSDVPSAILNDMPSHMPSTAPSDISSNMASSLPSSVPSEAPSVSHTSTQLSAAQCDIPVPRSSNHCALDEYNECGHLRSFRQLRALHNVPYYLTFLRVKYGATKQVTCRLTAPSTSFRFHNVSTHLYISSLSLLSFQRMEIS